MYIYLFLSLSISLSLSLSLHVYIFLPGFPEIQGISTGHAMKTKLTKISDGMVYGVWWG